jgi:class 3 adenylate cyclase
MTEHRRLAAIVSADVAGYSRLMGHDESMVLERLRGPLFGADRTAFARAKSYRL